MTTQDTRYHYSVCAACGHEWQNIDFGCALHQFMCARVESAERIPVGETERQEGAR